MTGVRIILMLIMTLASVQIAAADDKKTTTSKTSEPKSIEIQSSSWGGTNTTNNGSMGAGTSKTTGKGRASTPIGKTEASVGKH